MPDAGARVIGSLVALLIFYVALAVAPRLASAPASGGAPGAPSAELVQQANQLMAQGRWPEALVPVSALVAAVPTNHISAEHLATIYSHLGQPKDEAEAWEKFVLTSPSPQEACPHLGAAYRQAGDLVKAIDAFERCLTFEPTDTDLMFYAAQAAEWKNDWVSAARLYGEAAAGDPRNQVGLGRVALQARDYPRAQAQADHVLSVQEDADATLLGGLAALRSGHLRDARAWGFTDLTPPGRTRWTSVSAHSSTT